VGHESLFFREALRFIKRRSGFAKGNAPRQAKIGVFGEKSESFEGKGRFEKLFCLLLSIFPM
jgi:hypothetical protein